MSVLSPTVTLSIPTHQSVTDYVFSTENKFQQSSSQKDKDFLKQPAFVDGDTGETVTHQQVRKDAIRIASGMVHQYGLKKGDVIAMFAPNHINYPLIFLAALSIGIVVTTSNPMYTEKELSHQLKDSKAKMLFTTELNLELTQKVVKNLSNPIPTVIMDSNFKENGSAVPLSKLLNNKSYPRLEFNKSDTNNDNRKVPALIAYSSGTTGLPKGVINTHHNLIANLIQTEYMLKEHERPGLIVAGILPFFHCYGIMVSMLHGVHSFFNTVVVKKFDLKQFLVLIEKHKIEGLSLAPPIILQLAKNPMVDQHDLSSVKMILSGAAPLPSDVGKKAKERLGCQVFQGYGMTEASPVITVSNSESIKIESAGALVPNIHAKIVDPKDGKLLNMGKPGELWVKGPNMMMGYLNNPKATRDMFDNEGYMRTGDIGYFDKDRALYIVDRAKELIKYKGYQIAPAELEEVLVSHPDVKDCCVIAISDPSSGEELPKAFVVVDESSTKPNLDSIKEFAHKKLAPYKHLRGGLEYIDEIPKSPTGKILRRVLKDRELQRQKSKL